jgi:hypothetical protein
MALAERPNLRDEVLIPMTHILMSRRVAIYCTLVVWSIVMVACAEPWFTHALAIGASHCPSITRAQALQTTGHIWKR